MLLPDLHALRSRRAAALVIAGTTLKGALVGAALGKLGVGLIGGVATGMLLAGGLRWWARAHGAVPHAA